jgi:hypothetical protein
MASEEGYDDSGRELKASSPLTFHPICSGNKSLDAQHTIIICPKDTKVVANNEA